MVRTPESSASGGLEVKPPIKEEEQKQNVQNVLVLDAPCCASVRECNIKYIAIIGIRNKDDPRVLRTINAVRCHRGYRKKAKIYLSDDIIIVHHYVSNRGRVYISVMWKPDNITDEEAIKLASKAFGYHAEEEIVF